MATIDAKKIKGYTIKIPDNGREHTILNSNNKYKIECGELTSWDCMEEGGNSLCLMNSNGTTIIIKNWFKQSPSTVLNTINNNTIYDFNDPSYTMEIYPSPFDITINGNFVNNVINANNKSNIINAGGGYDIIDGKKGNDKIYFNKYNKGSQIFYNAGDGKDTIYNSRSEDVLVFRNIASEDLNWKKSGNNLILTNKLCKTDSVTIVNYFTSNSLNTIYCPEVSGSIDEPAIDDNLDSYIQIGLPGFIGEIEISGSGKIKGTKLDDVITGSKKNDIIYASGGADDVYAGAGNDIIYTSKEGSLVNAGAGNDKIYVNKTENFYDPESDAYITPENVIVFQKGSGNDTVYGGRSTDFIEVFGFRQEDLTYTKSGNNLVIKATYQVPSTDKMVTKSDSLTLVNWFSSIDKIDNIAFSETFGNFSSLGGNITLTVNGTAKNDKINANYHSKLEINSGKGNDIINIGGTGDKIVNSNLGEGNTTININENFHDNLYLNFQNKEYDLAYAMSADGKDLIITQNKTIDGNILDSSKLQTVTIKNYSSGMADKIYLNYYDYLNSEYKTNISLNNFITPLPEVIIGDLNTNNNITLDSSDNTTWIYGGNKKDIIDSTASGAIITTGLKGTTEITSGNRNDAITISNLAGTMTYINDAGGDEQYLEIYGVKKGDGITVLFDIAKNDEIQDFKKDMIFITSSAVKNYLKLGRPTTGVMLQNWLGTNGEEGIGSFENVYLQDATAKLDMHIDVITHRVREWLNDSTKNKRGYETAMDVLKYGTTTEKNSLMSIYTSENLIITSDETTNTYSGSDGNDVIYAGEEQTVNGGKGNDKLFLRTYDGDITACGATLNGGDGNDVLSVGSWTKLNCGKGYNVIAISESSESQLVSGGGADYIHYNNATIGSLSFEKTGNDLYISSEENGSFIMIKDYFKNPAKSSLKGIAFSDTEVDYKYDTAAQIVNTVKKNAQSLTSLLKNSSTGIHINEDEWNDIVKGSDIAGVTDYLSNSSANNKFYGYSGKNVIDFYAETDSNYGSGNDTIYSGKGQDYLNLENVNAADELVLSRHGNNLIIEYSDRDSITIADYYKLKRNTSIKGVKIGENTYTLLDLEKIATETGNFYDNKTIKNVINNEEQKDALIGNDTIYGTSGNDHLFSGDRNDTIYTGKGSDYVDGGYGDDIFYGQGGVKTYNFYYGYGNDTIIANKYDTTYLDFSGEDYIILSHTGVRVNSRDQYGNLIEDYETNAYFKRGNDLLIRYSPHTNYNNNITIKDFFKTKTKFILKQNGVEDINLRDVQVIVDDRGTKITGTSQKDFVEFVDEDKTNRTISTGAGDDIIYTGGGNSTIYAESGDDEIYVGSGNSKINAGTSVNKNRIHLQNLCESNTITIYAGKGNDALIFEDFSFNDLVFSRSGNNLVITRSYANPDSYDNPYINKVVLADYFKVNHSVNEIVTTTGNYYLLEIDNLLGETIANPNKKASITGTVLKDIIHGTIFNDTIKGAGNDDLIYGDAGNDALYGGTGSDTIYGGAGNDTIYGEAGDDFIYAGAGNDKINAGTGTNNLYFNNEYQSGTTTIYAGKGNDILNFSDVAFEDLSFAKSGNNLIITRKYNGENDIVYTNKISLNNYFKGGHSVNTINTTSGTYNLLEIEGLIGEIVANQSKKANITGTVLRDIIRGTKYNDIINGANNNDVIYGEGGNDTLYGGNGDDEIYGGAGNDIIKAGSDDGPANGYSDSYGDEIYGGTGNDKIYGESGYNRIYFSSGDGNDTIYMGKGKDEIYFDETVTRESVSFRGSGNNLVISYGQADENGKQSSITIVNYFTSSYKSVKSLIFESESCNGYDLEDYIIQGIRDKREGVPCNAYDGTAESNFIYLNSTSKKIIDCAYGSSYYIGEFWENVNDNDIIQSNSKLAYLEGGYGNDTYIVNSLSNTTEINDVQGTDAIILNENKSNVNFIFNVYKEGCAPEPDPEEEDFMNWGMFIMNDSSLNTMIKTKMRANVPNTSIYDFFNQRGETPHNYNIETIQTKDGYYVTYEDLNVVKEAVANWLVDSRFDSAIEALAFGNKTEVNQLLKIYQGVGWEKVQ